MFLLDTNVWIRFLNAEQSLVKDRIHQQMPVKLWLCDIVKAELYFGAYKSSRQMQNLSLLTDLFAQFQSLAFDSQAAKIFGKIRADLQRQGKPIGPYDLQIAAIALANDLTLITHNTSEFSRINGLRLADWELS